MFVLSVLLLAVVAYASTDEYLLLDIRNASTNQINLALRGLTVEYKLKVKGTLRHLIVINLQNTSLEEISRRSIPGKSSAIPTEDLVDTMRRVNVTWPKKKLTDVDVTLFERSVDLKDKTSQQYTSQLKAYGDKLKDLLKDFNYRGFRELGAHPPKAYFFVNLPQEKVEIATNIGIDIWGGPGEIHTSVQYMKKLN